MTCSAYRPGQLCTNGFPIGYPASSACTGRCCTSCGKPNEIVPACQDENIHPRWLNEDGSPKFVPRAAAQNKGNP